MSSDDDAHKPRSLAARIWERKWLKRLGLEDVPWEGQHDCHLCNRPRRKGTGRPTAHDHARDAAHDVEQDGPPSGTRKRIA